MKIRRASTGEQAPLRELRLRALADAPDSYSSTYEREAARPGGWWEGLDGAVFVAVDGERWLGMAGAFADDDLATIRLWGMWVAPEARRGGLGAALAEAVAGWARSRGASRLELSVTDRAPAAAALYERLGFRPTGVQGPMGGKPHLLETVLALALREPTLLELPADPVALAATLPDLPRWVETRSLLLSGEAELRLGRRGDGGVVVETAFPSACLVGRPDAALLQALLGAAPDGFELLVQLDALAEARAALPGWAVAFATIHSPVRPWRADADPPLDVVVTEPPDARALASLPEEIRRYAVVAHAVALSAADNEVVAVCAAGSVTETLWDVGVDTLEAHRRRGHAEAAFRALAGHMAGQGRQPVWGAEEDNLASMRLAAKLGFEPVDRLAVLSPRTSTAAG